ncbi:unnamed protein product, partial [Closterium sp. NIES-54]
EGRPLSAIEMAMEQFCEYESGRLMEETPGMRLEQAYRLAERRFAEMTGRTG